MSARSIVGAAAAFFAVAAPAAAAPKVDQLIVFKSSAAKQQLVRAAGTNVPVGSRSCAVGAGTALAALLRSGQPGVKLKDYGSCSSRRADAGGLYVSRIRKDAAKGANGWVYKVGNRVATTGAGDPSGPFGSGLLKSGARVTWFYCRMKASGCQRTLAVRPQVLGGGRVRVTVRGYDDRGKARLVSGATVRVGGVEGTTDGKGVVTVTATAGPADVHASAKGLVRSFEERIEVR